MKDLHALHNDRRRLYRALVEIGWESMTEDAKREEVGRLLARYETSIDIAIALRDRIRTLEVGLADITALSFNDQDECRWCGTEMGERHREDCAVTMADRALYGER